MIDEPLNPERKTETRERASDTELLRRYAEDHFEAAFAELVSRHVGLVYAAALRQVGGATHRAQDVAQMVFVVLARRWEVRATAPFLLLLGATAVAAGLAAARWGDRFWHWLAGNHGRW